MKKPCEKCNKERRVYRTLESWVCGELDDVFYFCFLCVKEDEREMEKERKKNADLGYFY